MTATRPHTESAEETGTRGPAIRFVVLTLLAADGVLSAVATALLLPAYIGPRPFPVSALIGGLVNAALVWAALHWIKSLRLAALPLWTWLMTVAAMTLGGPGDDLIFAGRGVMAYGVVVMIVLGAAPPAWLLWRRRQAATAKHGSGHEA
ncbi:MAG: hypothetical protein ACRDTN_20955 [Mycobacterium sp.]